MRLDSRLSEAACASLYVLTLSLFPTPLASERIAQTEGDVGWIHRSGRYGFVLTGAAFADVNGDFHRYSLRWLIPSHWGIS